MTDSGSSCDSRAKRSGRQTPLRALWLAGCLVASVACTSKVMKAEHSQEILKNDEFERAVKVQQMPTASPTPSPTPTPTPDPTPAPKPSRRGKHRKSHTAGAHHPEKSAKPSPTPSSMKEEASPTPTPMPTAHEPPFEDSEGFVGRRPKADPYRVGEKITLDVSYFGVSAGDMTLEVRPFVQVNGHKSYTFAGTAVSTSVFAVFYAVDDWFESFVDYDTMTPSNYALHVKETKQLRETRSLFDWTKGIATWWDKKIDNEQHVEEKKKEWEIPSFAQNIFSAPYYIRTFQLRPGKKIAFRVAHEGENLMVTTEVVRREHITTPAGEFDTVVIKPKIELNGVFKPVGDIFLWLTDDDRKFIVRIESKIKIGTIVAVAKHIDPGPNP